MTTEPRCCICSAQVAAFARAKILGRYDIEYRRCTGCGFIQSEEPYWLDEAYTDAISASDLGLVSRNLRLSKATIAVLSALFDRNGRFLDFAGGYGLLVRLMRDAGFDFYWHDKFCKNLFAHGFEAGFPSGGSFEMVVAYEVLEHLAHPLDEIEQVFAVSDNLMFTTTLLPAETRRPDQWWYFGLDHGQHVSLYTRASLQAIAARFRLNLFTDGQSMHLLTKREIPAHLFRLASRHRVATLISPLSRRKSLITRDYTALTGMELS